MVRNLPNLCAPLFLDSWPIFSHNLHGKRPDFIGTVSFHRHHQVIFWSTSCSFQVVPWEVANPWSCVPYGLLQQPPKHPIKWYFWNPFTSHSSKFPHILVLILPVAGRSLSCVGERQPVVFSVWLVDLLRSFLGDSLGRCFVHCLFTLLMLSYVPPVSWEIHVVHSRNGFRWLDPKVDSALKRSRLTSGVISKLCKPCMAMPAWYLSQCESIEKP